MVATHIHVLIHVSKFSSKCSLVNQIEDVYLLPRKLLVLIPWSSIEYRMTIHLLASLLFNRKHVPSGNNLVVFLIKPPLITGSSILCYDCNSAYDPRCGVEFDSFSLGIVNCSLRDPPEHLEPIEPTFCRSIKMESEYPFMSLCTVVLVSWSTRRVNVAMLEEDYKLISEISKNFKAFEILSIKYYRFTIVPSNWRQQNKKLTLCVTKQKCSM